MPRKIKDPDALVVECKIKDSIVEKVLEDLGASINVMLYKLFLKLRLGEPRPTWIILQLVDRSVRHPQGIIEDMLVRVNELIFPVTFVILDMEEDTEVPNILGHLLLAAPLVLIDVNCDGKLILRANNEELISKLPNAVKQPMELAVTFILLILLMRSFLIGCRTSNPK